MFVNRQRPVGHADGFDLHGDLLREAFATAHDLDFEHHLFGGEDFGHAHTEHVAVRGAQIDGRAADLLPLDVFQRVGIEVGQRAWQQVDLAAGFGDNEVGKLQSRGFGHRGGHGRVFFHEAGQQVDVAQGVVAAHRNFGFERRHRRDERALWRSQGCRC